MYNNKDMNLNKKSITSPNCLSSNITSSPFYYPDPVLLEGVGNCSLPLWRVHGIKRMYLASRTNGLFIT